MAERAIRAEAHGITVHPRPDQRHIKYTDVYELSKFLQDYPEVEFNIEGNPGSVFMETVLNTSPDQCTLVPDSPTQLTSDHGWDLEKDGEGLVPAIERLRAGGIRISLFMDPVPRSMTLAKNAGADRVELYTESYAAAFAKGDHDQVLGQYVKAAAAATEAGLGVNAGHDLDQENLGPFVKAIPAVAEVSIGHALISEALYDGLAITVRAYVEILREAESK